MILKIKWILVMLVFALPISASPKELYIQIAENKDIIASLSKSPKLTFNNSELSLLFEGQSVQIDIDKIKTFQYRDNSDESSIGKTPNSPFVTFTELGVSINYPSSFSIIFIDGTPFYSNTSFHGSFLYQNMPKGILILNINGKSLKIINR